MINRFQRPVLLALAMSGMWAGALRAEGPAKAAPTSPITVIFSSPENYTDVRDRFGDKESGKAEYLARLKDYLEKHAPDRLAAGQKLTVTFTDIDLAGDFEPWWGVRTDDIRILREIYPPRMSLNFVLTDADGKVLKQGERNLIDGGYLLRKPGFSDDDLRYDKELLNQWLRTEFPRAKN